VIKEESQEYEGLSENWKAFFVYRTEGFFLGEKRHEGKMVVNTRRFVLS
jgi:hypothetical protein